MKQYKETQDGSFSINGMTIPNNTSNRHYNQMIQEVANAEAEIVLFDHAAKAVEDAAAEEQAWAKAELDDSDIELYKVQDGEGVGSVGDWRAYRRALRQYYHTKDYTGVTRPVSPKV